MTKDSTKNFLATDLANATFGTILCVHHTEVYKIVPRRRKKKHASQTRCVVRKKYFLKLNDEVREKTDQTDGAEILRIDHHLFVYVHVSDDLNENKIVAGDILSVELLTAMLGCT